ncbi:benzoate 1,2-dioxygenase electron transfer component BenC [Aeromonas simiae]|uniref:2Fe-2S iron-sulfur cluster binding domain-containing protein n=1 Tax=Aeromonas simiae TaxID=218936 RepID=A0A5J6WX57_9GAMM|nr:benzoate 1,2-dioxygenase electron transfer component BenC [Aeromonas simiae]QFI54781.1 2Fe-2S iron-sulfur cluster binding domain-containing protein [Aeromonas simiae]
MSYNIALNFEDGVTRFIRCNAGETVLDAAYRNRIKLPMDCADGVCGTCKGRCRQGSFELGHDYIDAALTEQERAAGNILTCQMVPSSDCVVDIPAASSLCKTGTTEFGGTLAEINLVSPTAIALNVVADEPIHFLPGQYVNIQVPGSHETRAYSFSSRPGCRELHFLIRNVPSGLMSTWLVRQARIGERLTLSGPMGVFYLRPVVRPVLMLAGGTGLAPFLAMLAQLKVTGCKQPVHLIYGVTHDDDLVGIEALEQCAAELDQFSFKTVVADANSRHPNKGYVTHHMEQATMGQGEVDVYLCGPQPMVDAVLTHFRDQGIEPASFYYERFSPSIAAITEHVA